MTGYVEQPARRIPVLSRFDTVIVGGGIGGVAAALAAARTGASVGLVEKAVALGGLATLGHVVLYMHLCDGRGRQVVGGIGEELMRLSVADGFGDVPPAWKEGGCLADRAADRLHTVFNPAFYALALEEVLLNAGVRLYFDARFCDVAKDAAGAIDAVIIESKSGRQALRCRTVIDASGDADVCAAAGEPTESLDTNGWAAWFYTCDGRSLELHKHHAPFDRFGGPVAGRKGYRGDDLESVTRHLVDSREQVRRRLADLRAGGGATPFVAMIPQLPDLRMTRRLVGVYELTRADDRRAFDDGIGLIGDWREAGPVWSIPFRSLRAAATPNLLAVGRCLSADRTVWDATRVIPACAVTGQAAGTAAALAVAGADGRFDRLDAAALCGRLRADGAMLDVSPA
ncbi:MAG: FAD-dependent oxidoreductase [Planctomycetes bacterium]|nr:FAD-dependent oxidoreductase [Planctomycetota bacterium]